MATRRPQRDFMNRIHTESIMPGKQKLYVTRKRQPVDFNVEPIDKGPKTQYIHPDVISETPSRYEHQGGITNNPILAGGKGTYPRHLPGFQDLPRNNRPFRWYRQNESGSLHNPKREDPHNTKHDHFPEDHPRMLPVRPMIGENTTTAEGLATAMETMRQSKQRESYHTQRYQNDRSNYGPSPRTDPIESQPSGFILKKPEKIIRPAKPTKIPKPKPGYKNPEKPTAPLAGSKSASTQQRGLMQVNTGIAPDFEKNATTSIPNIQKVDEHLDDHNTGQRGSFEHFQSSSQPTTRKKLSNNTRQTLF